MKQEVPHSRPLGPDDISALVAAYKQVLLALHLEDHDDPKTQFVAKKVLESVRDPSALSSLAIEQLEAESAK